MSDVSRLTGLPNLPTWIFRIFLKYPSLVPKKYKWKSTSKGLGLLVTHLDDKNKSTADTLRELGNKQGRAISKELNYGKSVKEVMQVTVLANRMFGTQSRIIQNNVLTGKTKITKCAWAGGDWGEKPCALLSLYEIGLVEGLNPNIKTKFLKKISKGDEFCLTEYKMTAE